MALLPVAALMAVIAASCASMGRPEGGPKDELPPVFLTSDPLPGALNVKATKYRLRFDENIQLKDIQKNVIVSPAQKRQPTITGNGRIVTVELRDTLRDSTTYTIDFGDAITDLNEGNILDGFAYAFSTGPVIDSLAISGMVFEARTLEPAQGMIVGAYRASEPDSAITTKPLERLTRTNQYGQFTLRNLAPGSYRLYALSDANGDYHWDRSENIAFLGETVTPSTEEITVTDTVKGSDGNDSTFTHPGTLFLPNDVILTWFNEDYKQSYLDKHDRQERNRLSLFFNAPMDSMPQLAIVAPSGPLAHLDGKPLREWGALDASAHGDTLDVWIADSAVIKTDSLFIAARYLKTDTADRIVWATDTIKMFARKEKKSDKKSLPDGPAKKGKKKKVKGGDDAMAVADSATAAAPEQPKIKLSIRGGNTQQLNKPLVLSVEKPVAVFDSLAARLEVKPEGDSVWTAVSGFHLTKPEDAKLLEFRGSPVEWQSGASYRITVDSASMTSIYGEPLERFSSEFTARKRDEYSSIVLNITGTGQRAAVAELLSKDDKPVAVAPVVNGRAVFEYLEPSTYYARLFFDDNGNGRYDTGALLDSVQPEETVYYPKRIPLKKNWDLEQSWNIYETPLDQQKPSDIKKNKPKKKDGEEDSGEEEEEQQYDEFGPPVNGGYTNPVGNSGGAGRGSTGGRGGLGGGRFQTNTGNTTTQIRR